MSASNSRDNLFLILLLVTYFYIRYVELIFTKTSYYII